MTWHRPFLERSQKMFSTDEPKFCPPGLDHFLRNQNVYSSCTLWSSDFPRVTLVLTSVAAQIFSLFIGKPQRTICNEPTPGVALTNDSGQSPHPLTSPCARCVFGGYSIPFQCPKSCDGGVPTYIESITSLLCVILRCTPYVVFLFI